MLTVNELIKQLQKLPGNLKVAIPQRFEGEDFTRIKEASICQAKREVLQLNEGGYIEELIVVIR